MHPAAGQRRRRVVRELAVRILVAPRDLLRALRSIATTSLLNVPDRRGALDTADDPVLASSGTWNSTSPSVSAHGAELLVAAAEVDRAVHDRRRRVHLAVGLQLPATLPVRRVERIEMRVVRADQDDVAGDHRRRFDFAARLERPRLRAVLDVDRVDDAREVADVDQRRRRPRATIRRSCCRSRTSSAACRWRDRSPAGRRCPRRRRPRRRRSRPTTRWPRRLVGPLERQRRRQTSVAMPVSRVLPRNCGQAPPARALDAPTAEPRRSPRHKEHKEPL